MKFLIFYPICVLAITLGISTAQKAQRQSQEAPITIPFETAYNVSVGPVNILSAYSGAGVDFAINHRNGRVTISTDAGYIIRKAEVCRLDKVTWSAVFGDEYVTINAATGSTEVLFDKQYRFYAAEHP